MTVERWAQVFVVLVLFGTLPRWLWVQGKTYGAAEQAACTDHCAQVQLDHPEMGGPGILDPQGDRCTCARGEPDYIPDYDLDVNNKVR